MIADHNKVNRQVGSFQSGFQLADQRVNTLYCSFRLGRLWTKLMPGMVDIGKIKSQKMRALLFRQM